MLDGEAVILGVDGVSDFNALHSRKHDEEVQFCAGSDDLRKLPLHLRKTSLDRAPSSSPSMYATARRSIISSGSGSALQDQARRPRPNPGAIERR